MAKDIKLSLVSLYSGNNLGIRSIHSLLISQGYKPSLIFFKDKIANKARFPTETEYDRLFELLKRLNPDIVGISLSCSPFFPIASRITNFVKKELNIPVIWGGVHPTIAPEESIEIADILCIGEGEYPMLELVSAFSSGGKIDKIDNIWVQTHKKVTSNEIRPLIQNLDSLPLPDYSSKDKYFIEGNRLLDGDPIHHQWQYYIITSRGCRFNCSFCVNSIYRKIYAGKGNYVRQRRVADVIRELVYAKRHLKRVKQVAFYDDVFPTDISWIENFVIRYKKEVNIPFWCYFHPITVKQEVISMLRNAGLAFVNIGIQSGSERIRKQIFRRPESNAQILKAARQVQATRMVPYFDVIMDNSFDTIKDKEESLDLFLRIPRPFKLNLYSLLFFPKVEITRKALEKKLVLRTQIEGKSSYKTLYQSLVTFGYRRSKLELGSICLIVLTSKSIIPRAFIRWWSKKIWGSSFSNLWLLITITVISRYLDLLGSGIKLGIKGRLSLSAWRYFLIYYKAIK